MLFSLKTKNPRHVAIVVPACSLQVPFYLVFKKKLVFIILYLCRYLQQVTLWRRVLCNTSKKSDI
jgi:hypothetical protein